jgi:5-formyltetrahydrofolate cyclo-ligase
LDAAAVSAELGLAEIKRLARSKASKQRNSVHERVGSGAGAALAARGLPVARNSQNQTVSAFHPYLSEISTVELLAELVAEGWTTALPVVVGKELPLMFRTWMPGEPLVSGLWDIQIPADTAPEVEPDVLLVPMLAFDRKGYRLGYGGGFYDRTLAKLRAIKLVTAIGVAYSGQEIEAVPHDAHDQPLDWIMTERETFKCG